MKRTFLFPVILVCLCNLSQAQFTTHRDSIMWVRSFRFGCDISRFILTGFNTGDKALEFSGEFRLTPTMYPTVELGDESVNFSNTILSQSANGQYMRLGMDINLRNYTKDFSNNIIFFGFRYGIGNVNYQLNHYTIKDSIYGDYSGSVGHTHAYVQWVEAAAGVKVEVLKNIFLGWSIRGRLLLSKTQNPTLPFPYVIPGYGSGFNSTNVGFNYSIYYQIPFMKMKSKYKIKQKPKAETPKKTTSNTTSP